MNQTNTTKSKNLQSPLKKPQPTNQKKPPPLNQTTLFYIGSRNMLMEQNSAAYILRDCVLMQTYQNTKYYRT